MSHCSHTIQFNLKTISRKLHQNSSTCKAVPWSVFLFVCGIVMRGKFNLLAKNSWHTRVPYTSHNARYTYLIKMRIAVRYAHARGLSRLYKRPMYSEHPTIATLKNTNDPSNDTYTSCNSSGSWLLCRRHRSLQFLRYNRFIKRTSEKPTRFCKYHLISQWPANISSVKVLIPRPAGKEMTMDIVRINWVVRCKGTRLIELNNVE